MLAAIKSLIANSPLPTTVQAHLMSHCLVSFKSHRSISRILCNHIHFAKHIADPVSCVCNSPSSDPGLHRMMDTVTLDPVSQLVLGFNAESPPTPSSFDTGLSIIHALALFCVCLLRFLHPSLPRVRNSFIKSLKLDSALPFLASLLSGLGAPDGFFAKFFKSCWSKSGRHRSFDGVTFDMVRHTKNILSGWVVWPFDHNKGKLAAGCPDFVFQRFFR
jgi:hypothetical protein